MTGNFIQRILACAACLLLLSMPLASPAAHAQAAAQEGLLPVAEAFALEAGTDGPDRVRLDWRIADGYYLYRDRIRVEVVDGDRVVQAVELPAGALKQDENFGEVEVYHDRLQATVAFTPVQAGSAASPTRLRVVVQGCHEVEPLVCYPPHATTLAFDAGRVVLADAATAVATPADASPVASTDAQVPAESTRAPAGPARLASLLLLALAGGLLLNLMPCVLPVLSLKVLSLAEAGTDPAQARRRALAYTAGVLGSFAALGGLALVARQAGIALGWGFQLQQPAVVGLLAYVMLGLGLSLSGAVLFGARLGGVGHGLKHHVVACRVTSSPACWRWSWPAPAPRRSWARRWRRRSRCRPRWHCRCSLLPAQALRPRSCWWASCRRCRRGCRAPARGWKR